MLFHFGFKGPNVPVKGIIDITIVIQAKSAPPITYTYLKAENSRFKLKGKLIKRFKNIIQNQPFGSLY